jgi:hypothetical protein
MRELPVRLPSQEPKPRSGAWRDAFFFLMAFLTVFGGSTLLLESGLNLLS